MAGLGDEGHAQADMRKHSLDDIDRLIVQELTTDVQITYAALGARVGLSESQCLRRVRALESAKVILGYFTMADPAFLNLPVCVFVELRLRGANAATITEFEQTTDLRPDISACWRVSGDADYLLQCFVSDPQGYERLLNTLAGIDGVLIVRTHLVLRVVKRSPRFPVSSDGGRTRVGTAISVIGRKPDDHGLGSAHSDTSSSTPLARRSECQPPRRRFDEFDRRILRALANHARMPNAQLADRIGLSPAPCLRRVRALEETGAIQGYYVYVDLDALNLIVFFVMVHMTTKSTAWHEKFDLALSAVPEIVSAFRTNGGSDYVLLCMASGLDGVEKFLSSEALGWPSVEGIRSTLCLRYCNPLNLEKMYDVA